ncbi:iron-sulfur cluster assembly protein [Geomicrobium halophilum]|uniref:Iron-sulfur cluster assembly protein n=1 Tax=Geomicrobium halophilum TaxID=549000 RepID=A0A841PZL3_9BACL|nr:iron-sulfur cluster assembly accessory protein [Geomicrobium halophilum]MBB6450182.1 iron-sulfur cluster assembly protein [Geomicrobium halophilum]
MIEITDAAMARIEAMKEEEGDPSLKLRVGVNGGGCSGLSYGLGFDAETNEDDTVIDKEGLTVLIDDESKPIVDGLVIDYKENMMGGGFTLDNPNAILSCGCGASFRTEANAGTPENC